MNAVVAMVPDPAASGTPIFSAESGGREAPAEPIHRSASAEEQVPATGWHGCLGDVTSPDAAETHRHEAAR